MLLALASGVILALRLAPPSETACIPPGAPRLATVERALDGDTVRLEGGERVRYAGIDAPELGRPGGAEALQVNARLVEGRPVRLYRDVRQRDDYGRTLAYVLQGSTFVNAELVRRGLARPVYIRPDVSCYRTFLSLRP